MEHYTGLYQKKRKTADAVIYILIYCAAIFAVTLLLAIIVYVVVK